MPAASRSSAIPDRRASTPAPAARCRSASAAPPARPASPALPRTPPSPAPAAPPRSRTFAGAAVSPDTTYTGRVRAATDTVASDWSPEVSAPLPAAPAAPSGLAAQAASVSEIDLAWTGGGGNERAFAIWRKEESGDWHRVGVGAPQTTQFPHRALA